MSKRKMLALVAVLLSLLVFSFVQPSFANRSERILVFQSLIQVHRDVSMSVTENIKVTRYQSCIQGLKDKG